MGKCYYSGDPAQPGDPCHYDESDTCEEGCTNYLDYEPLLEPDYALEDEPDE